MFSAKPNLRATRAYIPTTALAKAVRFDDAMMHVTLTDGRMSQCPLNLVPPAARSRLRRTRTV